SWTPGGPSQCRRAGGQINFRTDPRQGPSVKMRVTPAPRHSHYQRQVFCVRDRSISLSAGWSERESVGELDGESVQGLVPSLGAGSELSAAAGLDVPDAQIDQLDRGLVRGEGAASLGDLPQLVVDRFDLVRGVDDLPDLGGERQERDE